MGDWGRFSREGTDLAILDFGGNGQPLVLLHGLAGHAGEWTDTAELQRDQAHVLAFDTRGHGRSERNPTDVSPGARADDVAFLIERTGVGRVDLVGQSLGGQTAISVAASRPDLVRRLVLVEAGPEADDDGAVAETISGLAGWPAPFESRTAAEIHFGGPSLRATRWVDGLETRSDGLHPCFSVDVLKRMLFEASSRSLWTEWDELTMPTLVVTGENGEMSKNEVARMAESSVAPEIVVVPGAGHDVHLDQVEAWNQVLRRFTRS